MSIRGLVGTAGTMAANFAPWLIASFLLGAAVGAYPTFLVTRAVYQRATLKAENNLATFDKALAEARAENAKLAQDLSNLVLENRDANLDTINSVAADVRELGQRVRLCATKSDLRISVTPSGAIEALPDGQPTDLAEVVRAFAEACAYNRDRDAADHNALVDWLEKMAKQAQ